VVWFLFLFLWDVIPRHWIIGSHFETIASSGSVGDQMPSDEASDRSIGEISTLTLQGVFT
jgi:hypothetical protein